MFQKAMTLDQKLSTKIDCHHAAIDNQDAFGLEIELEGLGIRTEKASIRNYWAIHEDNSLRNAIPGRAGGANQTCEYVSIAPLNEKNTFTGLKNMFDFLNSPGVEVFPSYRTSIHIHINCAMETWRTVYNFITLCIIFDELLASKNGEHRVGNNFCLRFVDAQGPIEALVSSISQYGNIFEFPANVRYSAINFASLRKFGTIEFRSLECNTDFERTAAWIRVCQKLKEAAREFQNPVEILGLFSRYTEVEFGARILGDSFGQYADSPNLRQVLRRGMRLAQDFAYSSSWKNKTLKEDTDTVPVDRYKALQEHAPPPQWAAPNVPAPPVNWGLQQVVPDPNFWKLPEVQKKKKPMKVHFDNIEFPGNHHDDF